MELRLDFNFIPLPLKIPHMYYANWNTPLTHFKAGVKNKECKIKRGKAMRYKERACNLNCGKVPILGNGQRRGVYDFQMRMARGPM